MTINLNAMPLTIDLLHVILGTVALLFFVLFLIKLSSKPSAPPAPSAEPATPAKTELRETTPDAALQLLSLLQQDARFIDFLNEDLTGFSDEEVGAAARVVHEGGKKTLNNYFNFEPLRSEEEESVITLAEGFNAAEIRLTGNVVGEAPFKGTLVHRGWKAVDIKLPKLSQGHDARIVAPAEVEL